MKLILINHNEEYAAREMITAYIPKIKIEVTTQIPVSGDYLVSAKNENSTYCATLFLNGNTYSESITSQVAEKAAVKKSIYEVMKKAFGTTLPWGIITGIRPGKMARELFDKGHTTEEIRGIFKNHYECDDDKAELAIKVSESEKKHISTMPKNSVSLYVGIPFCPTRCLYCSFTSQSIRYSNTLTEPYLNALFKEITALAEIIKLRGLSIDTVYIGGGTPTSLTEKQLDRLLDELYNQFDLSSVREFTLEAGRPDTITADKLRAIRNYDISRISINPQTMNKKTLEIIGRKHTPDDFLRTYELATNQGFGHINTDLIAGLPEETESDFEHTLSEIEKLNPQSVTVHTMSIKRGSYLDERYSTYTPSAAKTVNNMLLAASQSMASLKKIPYYMYRQKNMLGNLENVGYCDIGHECLYNIYIMEEVQSIFAIGAGASTKIINGDKIDRIFNVKEVSEYINRIDEMILRKEPLKKP